MFTCGSNFFLAFVSLRLEYLSPWTALGLFAGLGAIIVLLGLRSLAGLGPVRKWVAIGVRLAVLLLLILILGNVNWVRTNHNVEVMVVRDISRSSGLVQDFPGKTLQQSLDQYLTDSVTAAKSTDMKPGDRIGEISFNEQAFIDALPNDTLALDARAVHGAGTGTDAAAAIQLALASMGSDSMHRLLLIWDGNATAGDLEGALAAATAAHVPVDVMPLQYNITNEVMVDKFIAPTWRREGEAFTIEVHVQSTNTAPVEGNLSVTHNGQLLPLDGAATTRHIHIKPGLNVERIAVPPQTPGVHQFHATVSDVQNVQADIAGGVKPADTLPDNNSADTFTFVRGKGQVLYVDNVPDGRGSVLATALNDEGITLKTIRPDQFPNNPIDLQGFDAVILADVPRGADGLGEDQQKLLATYIHDMGGGLVMIGGAHTFGAGGWQGSRLEQELPVDMEIPAQRQIPKGALVLIMHSCEMPDGNYWGEQCALKAIETLSARDEIGVISYGWNPGGAQWDFPLAEKGDGTKVTAAIKKMQLGDMPSFDDTMNLALNGANGKGGLINSDAKQKHVIIISDGDPSPPASALVQQYRDQKITVSTISVYPHGNFVPPTMQQIAKDLKGRFYGPINDKPSQLPQIFIKEASVVKRTIIYEEAAGIPITLTPSSSEMVKGIPPGPLPRLYGMDLTAKKNNPLIEMPIVAGKAADPVLAHWQAGLGKSAVFTGDAYGKWAANWVGTPMFSKFWAQVVRGVSRPPMSSDFDVQMTTDGDKGHILVEAVNKENGYNNFLNIAGTVAGGEDLTSHPIRLVQTGPGVYEADFDSSKQGNYVCFLNYAGSGNQRGVLLSGTAVNGSPELRDLQSNDLLLKQITERTGGHLLPIFDPAAANLFTRDGLMVTESPKPIWDLLIPVLLGMILLDVAVRRIAWDWASIQRMAATAADQVRGFTVTTRPVENRQVLEGLKRVREETAEQKFKPASDSPAATEPRPNPSAKFDAGAGVAGDITQIVGGATDKPLPAAPRKIEPKGAPSPGSHTGSLLEAKRRAQQKIKDKEQEQ